MARIRTIKPEFFTSEDIVGLSPMARLLYIALWCEADRDARLVWKPVTFKLRYFPADNCDIQALCKEIIDAGLVVLYGAGYAHIPSFKAHQHINPRESISQLPDPDASGTRAPRVGTRRGRDSDAQGGREGKGKEGNEGDASFETFYQAYPKHEGRKDAEQAFAKLNPNAELFARMLAAIEIKRNTNDWTKEGGKFVPLPATWIRAERWNDEPVSARAGNAFAGAL